ncbi:MAG: ParA family protein [Alphaproteobacteria bacterium]
MQASQSGQSSSAVRVFAITNQKGGVGKTTTAINLATAFSALGHKVLLVDMDPQGNAGTGLGLKRAAVKRSVYDVLFERCTASEAAMRTKLPRLNIIPSSVHLAGADVELSSVIGREARLKEALAACQRDYDYIFIDCPPSLNFLTINALVAAQGIIVPLQCEFYALEGLSQLTKTVKLVQKHYNPALDIHGIALTMYDRRNRITKLVDQDVRGYFDGKVYKTTIPRNVRLSEAPSYGLPGIVYDMGSPGAQAYIKLAREILGRDKKPGLRVDSSPSNQSEHNDVKSKEQTEVA